MSIPNSRQTLIDWCLRKLGAPVLRINVDEDQLQDRVDEALQFYQHHHFDSMTKIYLKHKITQQDVDRRYIDLTKASGLASISNGSNVVTGTGTNFGEEFSESGSLIEINGQKVMVANVQSATVLYANANFTSTANEVPITNYAIADSIIGVTQIFPVGTSSRISMFDLQYQMRLNDMYALTSTSIVYYSQMQSHLRLLEMMFSGEKPVRFNRHQNRLYIDFQWGVTVPVDQYIIIEAFKLINPYEYTQVYNDMYLKKYLTALIKKQWGTNISKFGGMRMPGGIVLNGNQMIAEAEQEIEKLEYDMRSTWEEPPVFFVG